MATEYIVSKNRENKYGIIGLSTAVFVLIAENSIEELPDVLKRYGYASVKEAVGRSLI